ncbi:MAG: RNA ligase partner protein [Candidatus Omnitrophica bacterium 4484_70.2]|nr:MAG: RNA ligase partner protein [Candidatus Omnitrophica bacterium 4484_70.2]
MRKFVLDTSIFVSSQAYVVFGSNPQQAFNNFLDIISTLKNVKFFMPPSVKEELFKFIDEKKCSNKHLKFIEYLPPSKYEIKIPGSLLYLLIEDLRLRINKGLRIAEKSVRGVGRGDKEEEIIKRLRQEYRVALREGIIDSIQDVDLLLLSYQLKATLVSEDKGLLEWSRKLGIESFNTQDLYKFLGEMKEC